MTTFASPPAPIDPATGSTGGRRRKPKTNKQRTRFPAAPWVILPSVLLVFIFVYCFIAFSGWISLSNWKRPTRSDLSIRAPFGATYGEIFADQRWQASLRNMLVFSVGFLLLALVAGVLIALLVHHVTVGRGLFRSIFLLPYALSFIVTGVAFRWIFNPDAGINSLLEAIGFNNTPGWMTDPDVILGVAGPSGDLKVVLGVPVAMIPIIAAAGWQLMGFTMAMFLAGLAGIPEEQLEAASVDGASAYQRIRRIVLPQLWPVTVTAFVLLLHVSLKIFDLVVAMSGSGPGFATDVPGIYVFDAMTKGARYDKGSAAALVVLAIACIIVIPYLARSYKHEKG